MKIFLNSAVDSRSGQHQHKALARRQAGGSALIIVLILLSVMGTLVVSNTVTLRRLKVELELLEQKQIRAVQARPLAAEPPSQRAVE